MYGGKHSADYIAEKKYATAYFPIASFEQHGPHLPLTTDIVIAYAYAEEISTKIDAFMLPVQPFGTNYEHAGNRFSVGLDADIVSEMVLDIANEIKRQGFSRLVIHQGHGGLFVLSPLVRHLNANIGLKTVLVNPLELALSKEGILEGKDNLHACEAETSIMMHLDGDYVRMDKLEGIDFIPNEPRSFLNYKSIPALCENGVWGMPALATKEKGRLLIDAGVELSIKYIQKAFDFMDNNGDYSGGREAAYLKDLQRQ
jgi:creatinine amidohydrolase